MELETEWEKGTLIVMLEGHIDGSNSREFQSALADVTTDAGASLVLDMEQLTYISSAGIRVILQATRTLRGRNGRLLVCSLSGTVRDVFGMSGFDKIIETHDTRTEAIAALRS